MVKTVFVTGGAGFIGKHTIEKLKQEKFNIAVADRKTKPNDFDNNIKYYQLDVTSSELEKVFQENNIDYVIHLAALPSVIESIKDPQKDCKDNYYATVNVCTISKKYRVKKIVFSSTAAVYANPQYLPVDEKHPTDFLSPYAITKNASENFIKYCGIDYIIFRYSNVYGEGQDTQGEAGVVAKFFELMSNNQPVNIHGNGEQTRDFIYVKDVANANVLALTTDIKNEIINVSTNSRTSVNELFNTIKQTLNYTLVPVYSTSREGDIEHSVLNNDKFVQLFGYTPNKNLKLGINNMVNNVYLLTGVRHE